MENRKSSRKRGAQPGNTNSLKHGFYSSHFQPAEVADLKESTPAYRYVGLQDEIDLLRVFLRRTIEHVNAEKDITVETRLRALDVISKASARLSHLMSVHHLVTVKLPSKEEAQLYQEMLRCTRRSANMMLEAARLEKLGPSKREKERQLIRELDEILGPYQPPTAKDASSSPLTGVVPAAISQEGNGGITPPTEPPSPPVAEQPTSKPSRPRHKKSAPSSPLPVPEGRLPLGPGSKTEGRRPEGGRGGLCSRGRRPEAVQSPVVPLAQDSQDWAGVLTRGEELSEDIIPRDSPWFPEGAFEDFLAS